MATYVDGLSNVNLNELLTSFHKSGKVATLTAVKPRSQYGILEIEDDNLVKKFDEKPSFPFFINGGFFVFKNDIFNYLEQDDILEEDCFKRLIENNQLSAYKHHGFWKSMDTFKENIELNEMWNSGTALWLNWEV